MTAAANANTSPLDLAHGKPPGSIRRFSVFKWLIAAVLAILLIAVGLNPDSRRADPAQDRLGAVAGGGSASGAAGGSAGSAAAMSGNATGPGTGSLAAAAPPGTLFALERDATGRLRVQGVLPDDVTRSLWMNAIRLGAQHLPVADGQLQVGSDATESPQWYALWVARVGALTGVLRERNLSGFRIEGNRVVLRGTALTAAERQETERLVQAQIPPGFRLESQITLGSGPATAATAAAGGAAVASGAAAMAAASGSASTTAGSASSAASAAPALSGRGLTTTPGTSPLGGASSTASSGAATSGAASSGPGSANSRMSSSPTAAAAGAASGAGTGAGAGAAGGASAAVSRSASAASGPANGSSAAAPASGAATRGKAPAARPANCPASLASLAGPVYFQTNDTTITNRDRARLHRLGACLGNARLRVVGRADPRYTDEYNQGLSDRRARAVAAEIAVGGADASRLSVVGAGAVNAAPRRQSAASLQRSRRVDIQVR